MQGTEMAVYVSPNSHACAPLITGGYDCHFVEPLSDSLQCPVCLLTFRDPHLLSCCGHKGCAKCIDRIKAAGQPCPLCQQPFTSLLDKQLQRKVMDLRVFCAKKEEGCQWEGELRHLEIHSQRDCDHVEKECRYNCGRRYLRRLLRDHETKDCPQRPAEVVTLSLVQVMSEKINKLEAARRVDEAKLQELEKQVEEGEVYVCSLGALSMQHLTINLWRHLCKSLGYRDGQGV